MQGPELNIGFAVNGEAMATDGKLLSKRGLQPGDRLLLTKPLGTGTLFAAGMQLQADGRDLMAAIDTMLQSNRAAAELAVAHGASAGTDVTGFGLLGHLREMLGDDCDARLSLSRVPLLAGALDQLRRGLVSSMHEANARAGEGAWAAAAPRDEALRQILFDPQTSGGLLLGIAADRAAALRDALRSRGYGRAELVGEVTAGAGGVVTIS